MKLDSSNPPVYLPQADQVSVLRLGFENCANEDWLYRVDDLAVFNAHKRSLRESFATRCSAQTPGSEPAQEELYDLLLQQLTNKSSLGFHRDGDRLIHQRENLSWDIADRNLWEASMWVPEDICILEPEAGEYIMTAASVCSPSNWRLEEKIGRSVDTIHAPVPEYKEALSERVNRFLRSLKQGRTMLRYNWSVQSGNELYWQEDSSEGGEYKDSLRAPLYWRVERQTFQRLPVSGAIVFGIRIFLHSLASLRVTAGFEQSIAKLLAQLPAAQRRYKGIDKLSGF